MQVATNDIELFIQDFPGGEGDPLVLMHGLTVNGNFFGGVIDAGLADSQRVILVDLRGRGMSDKPDSGYTMPIHAADIIGLLDALGLDQVVLGGHSFGGLLSFYTAAHYPERVKKLIVIDAAAEVARREIVDLIKPSLQRLGQTVPSLEMYINTMQNAPYFHDGFWDSKLEAFYRSDVESLPDGSVRAHAGADQMTQAIEGVLAEDWKAHLQAIQHPVLLLHAPEGFGPPGTAPVVSEKGAKETVDLLPNCHYVQLPGNHMTMMFGDNAKNVVREIEGFI